MLITFKFIFIILELKKNTSFYIHVYTDYSKFSIIETCKRLCERCRDCVIKTTTTQLLVSYEVPGKQYGSTVYHAVYVAWLVDMIVTKLFSHAKNSK